MLNINGRNILAFTSAVLVLALSFSGAVEALTEQEYAVRCSKAAALCRDSDEKCAAWRSAFNEHGSVCPGVNAPTNAIMHGPTDASVTPNVVATDKFHEFYQLCTPHDIPLSSAVPCVKALVKASADPIINMGDPGVQLYVLEADKLVADLAHKRISEPAANEKWLRMILKVEDRHRPQLEAQLAREATIRTQQLQQEAEQIRVAAEVNAYEQRRRDDVRAAKDAQERATEARRQEAVEFCISEASQRIAANPRFRNDNTFALGIFQVGNSYENVDKFCAIDRYWYKQVPAPQKFISCQNQGMLGVNCTEQ